jgi:hypothetical protein
MGELVDRLERLAVEAWSPDGRMAATAEGRYQVRLRFVSGAYRKYDEVELGHQLAQLATVLWTRYRREYTEIVAAFHDDDDPATDEEPRDRIFRERLEQLDVSGTSAQGSIALRSRALVRWEVVVTEGTLRRLTEEQFLGELDSAIADILGDYQAQLITLTDELYDIGVPASFRQSATVDR